MPRLRIRWRICSTQPAPEPALPPGRHPLIGVSRCSTLRARRSQTTRLEPVTSLGHRPGLEKSQVRIPVQHVGERRRISRALVYLAACLLQGCAYVRGAVLHLVLQMLVKLNGKVSCDFVIHRKQRPDISAGARIQHGWSPTIDKVAGMFLFSYIACVEEEERMVRRVSVDHP